MKIREYETADRQACLEIFKSNIPTFFLPEETPGYEAFLDKTHSEYWVLENGTGKVLACGGIGVKGDEGRLHFGLVDSQYHKKGIGTTLLNFRLARLVEKPEVKAISLDTSQHNPTFFSRFGFVETNVTKNAYGPDLHRHDMKWDLPQDAIERKNLIERLNIQFSPMTAADFDQFNKWLNEPHVKKVWLDSMTEENFQTKIASAISKSFIVEFKGHPIGYMQYYWASKVGGDWWKNYGSDTVGFDFYIGNPAYLGKGLGELIIRYFSRKLMNLPNVKRIITDPSPDNAQVIYLLKKQGFESRGEINTPDGKAILFELKI